MAETVVKQSLLSRSAERFVLRRTWWDPCVRLG